MMFEKKPKCILILVTSHPELYQLWHLQKVFQNSQPCHTKFNASPTVVLALDPHQLSQKKLSQATIDDVVCSQFWTYKTELQALKSELGRNSVTTVSFEFLKRMANVFFIPFNIVNIFIYLQWCALSGLMQTHFGHLYTISPSFRPSFIIFSLVALPFGTAPCKISIHQCKTSEIS